MAPGRVKLDGRKSERFARFHFDLAEVHLAVPFQQRLDKIPFAHGDTAYRNCMHQAYFMRDACTRIHVVSWCQIEQHTGGT